MCVCVSICSHATNMSTSMSQTWLLSSLALLRRVPVQDEPRGVNSGDQPAVGAEHVEKQHAADSA